MPSICIISSGTENLNIVKVCQKLFILHSLFIDTLFRPYQDKEAEFVVQRVQQIMEYMTTQWATHFILSPTIELSLKYSSSSTLKPFSVIPLFQNYLKHCLQHSLIWKIGFVGGYSDIGQIESFFSTISKEHQLTENQKNTKKFQQPLSKRSKDTSMREYFSRLYSPRSLLINKTIKEDLRYFKDANIDTLIPLNYSYFNYQRTISSHFNQRKQKFHKRETVEEILQKLIPPSITTASSNITTIYYTWSAHLINNKKHEALLSNWWKNKIEYKPINL